MQITKRDQLKTGMELFFAVVPTFGLTSRVERYQVLTLPFKKQYLGGFVWAVVVRDHKIGSNKIVSITDCGVEQDPQYNRNALFTEEREVMTYISIVNENMDDISTEFSFEPITAEELELIPFPYVDTGIDEEGSAWVEDQLSNREEINQLAAEREKQLGGQLSLVFLVVQSTNDIKDTFPYGINSNSWYILSSKQERLKGIIAGIKDAIAIA